MKKMPSSSPPHPAQESLASSHSSEKEEEKPAADDTITASDLEKQAEGQETPSDAVENHHANVSSSPSPLPADVPPFDWDDFETRYERALREADEAEREILKEAESLSKVYILPCSILCAMLSRGRQTVFTDMQVLSSLGRQRLSP